MIEGTIYKLKAFHLYKSIDLKTCKATLNGKVIKSSSVELFIQYDDDKYLLLFNYGVVVFFSYSEQETHDILSSIEGGQTLILNNFIKDEYGVKQKLGDYDVSFDHITVPEVSIEVIRIIMFNLGQSVALKYFDEESQELLGKTKRFATELALNGKLSMPRKSILRFIGKALSTQNLIVENLYILDAHPDTWENENLEKINVSLSKHFELGTRYKSIDNTIKIIQTNLSTFMDLFHHKESSRLEWIIIILILFEIVNTLFNQLH